MILEEAIKTKLSASATITAVVSSRIYYMNLPDNATFPAVSFQRVGTARDYTMTDTVQMAEATIQVDSWSQNIYQAVTLGDEVRKVLDGFRGTVGDIKFERFVQQNELDLPELEGTLYRRMQTYRVIFQEDLS